MVGLKLQVCPVDQERGDHLLAVWDPTSLSSPYLKDAGRRFSAYSDSLPSSVEHQSFGCRVEKLLA